ncbi:hypothetical protein NL108_004778 [Boleophthalmus pectinirostris]|nr:hypothetical protein NL108_004778 [Boleophthalmus pectinirostris]
MKGLNSSIAAAHLQLEAEKAVLLVRLSLLKEKHAIEEQMAIIRRKKEQLDMEMEILEMKAEIALLKSKRSKPRLESHKLKGPHSEKPLPHKVTAPTPLVTSPVSGKHTGAGTGEPSPVMDFIPPIADHFSDESSPCEEKQTDTSISKGETQPSEIFDSSDVANSQGIGPDTVVTLLVKGTGGPLRKGQGRTGLPDDLDVVFVDRGKNKLETTVGLFSLPHMDSRGDCSLSLSWPPKGLDKAGALFHLKRPRAFKRKRWKS